MARFSSRIESEPLHVASTTASAFALPSQGPCALAAAGGADGVPDALGRSRQLDVLDAELASTIALATAASPGVIPPSLPPRIPSGFVVDGTSLISVSNAGSRSARGIA